MRIGLMVEGQNGLTWERWIHILGMAERLGFPTLMRSDHYFIGRQQDSLEAYLSFAVAARETSTIRFGPLVSPVTFRSPVDVGRMAAQIDHLSGGRFVIGLGAGWNEAEHAAYGIPFPEKRFGILTEEMVEVFERLVGTGAVDLIDMSLWDVRRNAADGVFAGQSLLDVYTRLERGDVRLAVAGKIHEPADVQEVLDRGVDIAALGRVAILHHDYPHLMADPTFAPRHAPVTADVLIAEGVSSTFVDYLRSSFKGFVAA